MFTKAAWSVASMSTFFLLLFESVHYVGMPDAGFTSEAQANWRWGVCGLSGFLLAGVLDVLVLAIKGPPPSEAVAPEAADPRTKKPESDVELFESRSVSRVRAGVIIGDFVHNLVDGVFIGAAFRYCGSGRGWAIAASTIIHEFAQELGDFVILTGKRGKLSPALALTFNFVSGCSVLLGTLLTMAFDFSNLAVGLLLSFSAGVYIHVGATEAMGSVYTHTHTAGLRLVCMVLFCIGAALIGIVLIDHSHCQLSESTGESSPCDAHAGHDHGR